MGQVLQRVGEQAKRSVIATILSVEMIETCSFSERLWKTKGGVEALERLWGPACPDTGGCRSGAEEETNYVPVVRVAYSLSSGEASRLRLRYKPVRQPSIRRLISCEARASCYTGFAITLLSG